MASWTRVEPVSLDPTLADGIRARVADPLWLLARQASFGEFQGEDAASPIATHVEAATSTITRLRPANAAGPGEPLDRNPLPLEVLLEAEAEPQPPSRNGAETRPHAWIQAARQYLRMLTRATGIGDLTTYKAGLLSTYRLVPAEGTNAIGLPPLPAGDPLAVIHSGRTPDGAALYHDLDRALRPAAGGPGALPTAPSIGAANASVITAVARQWLNWCDATSARSLGSRHTWQPQRLEYAADIAAPGPQQETVFRTSEYTAGSLDWLDFDLLATAAAPATPLTTLGALQSDPGGSDTTLKFSGLPTPVQYRGMPSPRWWSFEDGAVNFGAVNAPAESITTSLMLEFALRYGNDHYLIPLPLPVGTVCRINLTVTDTFGETITIPHVAAKDGANGPFRLFEHSFDPNLKPVVTGRDPLFVLFPTLVESTSGPPLEEVHYLRDEAADLAWAVEETTLGPAGLPIDRNAAEFQRPATAPTQPRADDPNAGPVLRYQLRTDIPGNWFALLIPEPPPAPPQTTSAPAAPPVLLFRSDIAPLDGSDPPLPWGRLLAEQTDGVMQEEITRSGVQVRRLWRCARAADGRQLSWVGRTVSPGRGTGASGLQFDLAPAETGAAK